MKSSHINKKSTNKTTLTLLPPSLHCSCGWLASVCPVVPQYQEKELFWDSVFGRITLAMSCDPWFFLRVSRHPSSPSILIQIPFPLFYFPVSLCILHWMSSFKYVRSSQLPTPSLYTCGATCPLRKSIRASMVAPIHLVCTLWLFSPLPSPLIPCLFPFLPSSFFLRSIFLLLLERCYQPTMTAYTSRGLKSSFCNIPKTCHYLLVRGLQSSWAS